MSLVPYRARVAILFGLQYLRAVAAVLVVLFHNDMLPVGRAGVDLFFVLSGFLMVAITNERTRPGKFIADRLRRIVPAYWIVTTLVAVAALVGLFPKIQITTGHLVTSYLFIPSFSPNTNEIWPLLVPGWTLNYEIAFYLLFAALMALSSQLRQMIALTAIFVVVVIAGLIFRPETAILITYSNPILLEFAAGGWLGLMWKGEGRWPALLGLPCIAVGAFLLFLAHGVKDDHVRAIAFGIPAVLIVTGMLTIERRRPFPPIPGLLLLGNASYSIYLWHTLATSLARKVGPKLGLTTTGISLLGIVIGLIVGIAGYRLIEKPILAWFRERRAVNGVIIPNGP